ncbi:MAG: hypothetical protein ACOCZ8_00385 [Bacteroidota bacterium]
MAMTLYRSRPVDAFAKAVSVGFHPGFQQVYLILFVAAVTGRFWITLGPTLLFSLALPTAFYMWFKRYVLAGETIYHMHRKDRFWPTIANIVGLALTALSLWILGEGTIPSQITTPIALTPFNVILMVLVINLIGFSVTFFYKISYHMLATAAIGFIFYSPEHPWLIWSVLSITIPLVGWSRYYLHGHTIDQIIVGTVVGLSYATVVTTWLI